MSARERAAQSAKAQGLPEKVEDPSTLDRIATLLTRSGEGEQWKSAA